MGAMTGAAVDHAWVDCGTYHGYRHEDGTLEPGCYGADTCHAEGCPAHLDRTRHPSAAQARRPMMTDTARDVDIIPRWCEVPVGQDGHDVKLTLMARVAPLPLASRVALLLGSRLEANVLICAGDLSTAPRTIHGRVSMTMTPNDLTLWALAPWPMTKLAFWALAARAARMF